MGTVFVKWLLYRHLGVKEGQLGGKDTPRKNESGLIPPSLQWSQDEWRVSSSSITCRTKATPHPMQTEATWREAAALPPAFHLGWSLRDPLGEQALFLTVGARKPPHLTRCQWRLSSTGTSTSTGQCGAFYQSSFWASLVVQRWRIRLPVLELWVQALVREDPPCHGATKPMHDNYWASALDPGSHHNYGSPCSLGSMHCNKRSPCNRKARSAREHLHSPPLEKSPTQQWRHSTAKSEQINMWHYF